MTDPFGQSAYAIRMEWGPVGAVRARAAVVVVVDVLSFSTSVCIAVDRGMEVYPFRWRDDGAADFALAQDAVLAVGRFESVLDPTGPLPSLSPASLLACEPHPRLVLPSPNGSTIADVAAEAGAEVVIGSLRNADAVAAWLSDRLAAGSTIALVAAGERWEEDDSLRPALEDHLGAGAILAALAERGHGHAMSPEACAAADLFAAARPDLPERLFSCVSGRELIDAEFHADIAAAADLSVSAVVPVLRRGAFGPG